MFKALLYSVTNASWLQVTPDLLVEEGYSYVMDFGTMDDQPVYMSTRSGKPILAVPYAQASSVFAQPGHEMQGIQILQACMYGLPSDCQFDPLKVQLLCGNQYLLHIPASFCDSIALCTLSC